MITVKRTHNILHHFSMRIISNADERTLLSEDYLLRCTQRYWHTYPIVCWVQYHFFSRYGDFKKMPALKITKVSTPSLLCPIKHSDWQDTWVVNQCFVSTLHSYVMLKLVNDGVPPLLSRIICAWHPAVPSSSTEHTIYALIIGKDEIKLKSWPVFLKKTCSWHWALCKN